MHKLTNYLKSFVLSSDQHILFNIQEYAQVTLLQILKFLHQSTGRLPVIGCTNTTMDNKSKKAKHINDPRSLQIKASFSCQVTHTSMLKTLCGNRSGGRVLCLRRLSRYLVQELDVGTV